MKIFFIHQTNIGSLSATGQLLEKLVKGISGKNDIVELASKIDSVHFLVKNFYDLKELSSPNDLVQIIDYEKPDVIVYRPDAKINFLSKTIVDKCRTSKIRLILSLMDAWFNKYDKEFNRMINCSNVIWFISEALKENVLANNDISNSTEIFVIANGINPEDFKMKKVIFKHKCDNNTGLRLGYMGAINKHQTFDALNILTSKLSKANGIVLDIYSRQYGTEIAKKLRKSGNINLFPPVDNRMYLKVLSSFDVLVLPYGFSDEVKKYLQWSFGNKISEALATGLPLLVLGDRELNSIKYLSSLDNLKCITDIKSMDEINSWLEELNKDYYGYYCNSYKNRELAFEKFNIDKQIKLFNKMLAI